MMKKEELEALLNVNDLKIQEVDLMNSLLEYHPIFLKDIDRKMLLKETYQLGGIGHLQEMEGAALHVKFLQKEISDLKKDVAEKENELAKYIKKWN